MRFSHVLGVLAAIGLIIFSLAYPMPEKHVRVSSSYSAYNYPWLENQGAEYVGGDAYNYQIEASLKAGYMTGIMAMKSITFVGGLLLFFLTLYSNEKCTAIEAQTRALLGMSDASEVRGKHG